MKENCLKLIGYPPNGRGRGKTGFNGSAPGFRTYPQAMQVSSGSNYNNSSTAICELNASASSSTGQTGQTNSFEQLQQQVLHMSQMMSTLMAGKGSQTPEDHISNILLVPSFNCNVLSVSKLTSDSKCAASFFPNSCIFQDQTW